MISEQSWINAQRAGGIVIVTTDCCAFLDPHNDLINHAPVFDWGGEEVRPGTLQLAFAMLYLHTNNFKRSVALQDKMAKWLSYKPEAWRMSLAEIEHAIIEIEESLISQ